MNDSTASLRVEMGDVLQEYGTEVKRLTDGIRTAISLIVVSQPEGIADAIRLLRELIAIVDETESKPENETHDDDLPF